MRARAPLPRAFIASSVVALVAGAGACRAHTQDLALDQAAADFYAVRPLLCWTPPVAQVVQGDGAASQPMEEIPDVGDTRARLTPWIVGPNQYLIEGCKHEARYVCDSESCRREGKIVALTPYKEPAISPAREATAETHSATAGSGAPAAAPADDSDGDTVRTALEAQRAEITSCVDRLPVGVKVEYAPNAPPTISLRGDLHGKPEEACVRTVLKPLKAASFKTTGTVIHVLK